MYLVISLNYGISELLDIVIFWLQVNTNGVVSFGAALPANPSESLPVTGIAFVAPFWADIDTRTNGSVYHR